MFIIKIYCQIKQKKFEVLDRRMMFNGLMALMSVTGAVPPGKVPDNPYNGNQVKRRKCGRLSRENIRTENLDYP